MLNQVSLPSDIRMMLLSGRKLGTSKESIAAVIYKMRSALKLIGNIFIMHVV